MFPRGGQWEKLARKPYLLRLGHIVPGEARECERDMVTQLERALAPKVQKRKGSVYFPAEKVHVVIDEASSFEIQFFLLGTTWFYSILKGPFTFSGIWEDLPIIFQLKFLK